MLKYEIESYVRIGEKGLKNLTYPYMGVGGVKYCQNHPYVINKWPLISYLAFECMELSAVIQPLAGNKCN